MIPQQGKAHNKNLPMQYTEIISSVKIKKIIRIKIDIFNIHVFAQNIDDGYSLEPPR